MAVDWGNWGERPEIDDAVDRDAEVGSDADAQLWRDYIATGDKEVRDKLILEYYGLVKYVAARLVKTLPASVALNDLASYGLLGLVDAIDRFEPERGLRFSTFASPRIRGAILDGLRSDDWVPREVRRRSRALGDAEARLTNSLGRKPTDEEMAAEVGISLKELEQRRVDTNAATLERLDPLDLGAAIVDSHGPEQTEDVAARTRILVSAINDLPDRTKLIVALYYYEKMSLAQIGAVFGISQSRVSRILAAGVAGMRQKVGQEDLEDLAAG